jgi:hypothetical protein
MIMMPSHTRQNGAVLILMFVAMVMTALTVFVAAINNSSVALKESARTREALQAAKQQLLAYAMGYSDYFSVAPNGPGRLPCPDTNNDGLMNCGVATLGRLPTQEILPSGSPFPFSDSDAAEGQQFWYAVTASYRSNSATLNTTSASTFTFNGVSNIVAVIMAPGDALSGQVRESVANRNSAANYLENGNQTGPTFVSSFPATPTAFNDVVVAITRDEVMTLATVRVAQEFKRVLDSDPLTLSGYPANQAIFLTALPTAAAWIAANGWNAAALQSYTAISATVAEVKFNNCNTVFRFEFGVSGITRTPLTCEG